MSHIRSSSLLLNFVELHNLDVYVILAILVFLFIFVPCYYVKLSLSNMLKKRNCETVDKKSK